MKRLLFILPWLLLAVTSCQQKEQIEYNGLLYYIDYTNKTASVIGHQPDYNSDIDIPNSIFLKGMQFAVTSIGERAFEDCTNLTSIDIPNSVTSIGEEAFVGCEALTSITIPDSVTTIGDYAFSGCDSLTSINIPNSVTSIGNDAFFECKKLTAIHIPASVTSIGNNPFSSCEALETITVDENNTVYNSANNCNAIIETASNTLIAGFNVTDIPSTLTGIGDCAFYECKGLTSINIPNSVTSIGNDAFALSGLTSITIPNSVTSIGDCAFYECKGLTSVTIPNSVTSIGESAFLGCEALTSITIPDAVKSIGVWAFSDCSGLTDIYVKRTNPAGYKCQRSDYDGEYGTFENIPEDCTLHVPAGCANKYRNTYPWDYFNNIVEN